MCFLLDLLISDNRNVSDKISVKLAILVSLVSALAYHFRQWAGQSTHTRKRNTYFVDNTTNSENYGTPIMAIKKQTLPKRLMEMLGHTF